jgi:SpoVK/Ycf46/Vps4 family AAA+-type ATPase
MRSEEIAATISKVLAEHNPNKPDLDCPRTYAPEPVTHRNCLLTIHKMVGLEEERKVLQSAVIKPMVYPTVWQSQGKRHQNVLLYGVGGVGKTALARAVALEADLHFFNVRASEVLSHLAGMTTISFRKLIDTAKQYATGDKRGDKNGALVMIDEADVLLADPRPTQGADETVAAEFKSLFSDGRALEGLVFWANTNHPDRITDTGLLRRFGVQLYLDLPNEQERLRIVGNKLRQQYPLPAQTQQLSRVLSDLEVDWPLSLAPRTLGYSAFALEEWVNYATSTGELQLNNADRLEFCQDTSQLSTRAAGNAPVLYYPELQRNRDTEEVGLPPVSLAQLERKLRQKEKVMIVWPVITIQDLQKALDAVGGVKSSTHIRALQKMHSFAEGLCHDTRSASRIWAMIQNLDARPMEEQSIKTTTAVEDRGVKRGASLRADVRPAQRIRAH